LDEPILNPFAKIIALAFLVAGSASWLAYRGGQESWQYYLTADECLRDAPEFVGKRLRINGRVAVGSLKISDSRSEASFQLRGEAGSLSVACPAPLPDNLAEDMDVVVEGTLEEASFIRATKVLTRCASKYESQEKQK
jgi:cytochrome c-type biogenesis protein CcmE